jgi:hypothetical protein
LSDRTPSKSDYDFGLDFGLDFEHVSAYDWEDEDSYATDSMFLGDDSDSDLSTEELYDPSVHIGFAAYQN